MASEATESGFEHVAAQAARWVDDGHPAALGRVVELHGFSTWPGGELVVADGRGTVSGDVLGRHGEPTVTADAHALLAEPAPSVRIAVIEVHGAAVAEAGLSCGGQAHILLQPADCVPPLLWAELGRRAPVALVSRVEGPEAGRANLVVTADGRAEGPLAVEDGSDPATESVRERPYEEALALLGWGHSATRRVEDPDGAFMVSAWVPTPRLVVVGSGDLVTGIAAQAALLGWATRATETPEEIDGLLDWAAGSAATIVLTHNPHVDAAALQTALARGAHYVGAMGSRATQSRRIERLRSLGVADAELERIHRPIGLDLGGRSAPEVALAICAEILAGRSGRDGRPLRDRTGSIRGR